VTFFGYVVVMTSLK